MPQLKILPEILMGFLKKYIFPLASNVFHEPQGLSPKSKACIQEQLNDLVQFTPTNRSCKSNLISKEFT